MKRVKSGIKPGQPEEVKKPSPAVSKSKGKSGGAQSKKKGGRKQQQDEEEEDSGVTTSENHNLDIAINEEEIKKTLMASPMTEFKDNKDDAEILLESLADFLLVPVNRQFQTIFQEAFARMSTKSSASSNKNLEQDVEDSFQLLQVIQKQMENLKKSITNQESKSISDYEAVISPIKAHYAKNEC